jgi:hypothetical protein
MQQPYSPEVDVTSNTVVGAQMVIPAYALFDDVDRLPNTYIKMLYWMIKASASSLK